MPSFAAAALELLERLRLGLGGLGPVAANGRPMALPTTDVAADAYPSTQGSLPETITSWLGISCGD